MVFQQVRCSVVQFLAGNCHSRATLRDTHHTDSVGDNRKGIPADLEGVGRYPVAGGRLEAHCCNQDSRMIVTVADLGAAVARLETRWSNVSVRCKARWNHVPRCIIICLEWI